VEVRELGTEDEMRAVYPLMAELRPQVTEERYLALLRSMVQEGYRLFALRDAGIEVALAGVGVGTNLYFGRYMWVFDLITSDRVRSRGYGRALLEHVERVARDEGCEMVALSSGVQRTDAHRFYEQHMGYERASYVFRKSLEA
jgi:GNAT superfamily N-acetyltransferase